MSNKVEKVYWMYDDGKIKILEGEELRLWQEACITTATVAQAHGHTDEAFKKVQWKLVTEPITLTPKINTQESGL